jgi:hypothetical protein
MTAFVDVTFRGLRVAHKAKLTVTDTGAFLELEAPLPVGSPVAVIEDGQAPRAARVDHVVEHEAGAGPAGMRLAWADTLRVPVGAPTPTPIPVVAEPAPVPAADAAPVPVEPEVSADASTDSSDDSSAADGSS